MITLEAGKILIAQIGIWCQQGDHQRCQEGFEGLTGGCYYGEPLVWKNPINSDSCQCQCHERRNCR